ncbi:MAG: hypothetical protein FWB97_08900 [Oscillospiraceae bacterium]|nr:hypothetical protein [Oscillospiraceae bacterium]
MKLEVSQHLPTNDAQTKLADGAGSAQENDAIAKVGGAAVVEADVAIEAELRKGPAVLISSSETEMARGGKYASFKTEEGFVTLGKTGPAEGLDALDKKVLDKAIEKATYKAAVETEIGTSIDKTALLEAAKAKAAAAEFKSTSALLVVAAPVEKAHNAMEPLPRYMRDFSDRSLEQYAKALDELKLPVRESSAILMSQIMEGKASMASGLQERVTVESAAFLASAGIRGEAGIQAALDILSGTKMDGLIKSLLGLLDGIESPQAEVPDSPVLRNDSEHFAKATVAAQAAGISDIFSLLTTTHNSAGPQDNAAARNSDSPQSITQQTVAPQTPKDSSGAANNTTAHSSAGPQDNAAARNSDSPQSITQQTVAPQTPKDSSGAANNTMVHSSAGPQDNAAAHNSDSPQSITQQRVAPQTPKDSSGAANNTAAHNSADPQDNAVARNSDSLQSFVRQPEQNVQIKSAAPQISLIESGMMGASMAVQDALVNTLVELPEFKNTTPKYILKFSEAFARVVGEENTTVGQPSVEDFHEQLDRLFTNIDRGDPDLGKRLSHSREELFLRLMLIEEAVSRMDFAQRAEAMEQVQQLLNHVRVLNSIEHIVYMQLPVKLNGQETTAELYVFKKKGKKQIDPENVNVLLAVELQHLGRWEGLINIQSKDVSIKMDVPGEQEKGFFGENTIMLHKLLHEIGFVLKNSTISYTGENTTPLNAMLSLEQLQTGWSSGLGTMDYTV